MDNECVGDSQEANVNADLKMKECGYCQERGQERVGETKVPVSEL